MILPLITPSIYGCKQTLPLVVLALMCLFPVQAVSSPDRSTVRYGSPVATPTALHKSSSMREGGFPYAFAQPPFDNSGPGAGDDFAGSTCSGSPLLISEAALLANDSNPTGKPLKIQDVTKPANGTLRDNGNGTYTYTSNPGFSGTDTFTYTVKEDDHTSAFSGNGHYFEYVAAKGISWTEARAAAEKRFYNGLQGYLATMSSAEENEFVQVKLKGTGWIGASDFGHNGIWKWVTGPEAGIQFSQQVENGTGYAVNGQYANWSRGEPNDHRPGEDYAHFWTDGTWNDYVNVNPGIEGYIVEYGGLEQTPPALNIVASATVSVTVIAGAVFKTEVAGITCAGGGKDGSITIQVAPGDGPYTYSLNGGAYSAKTRYEGLAPGNYAVRARAATGCIALQQVAVGGAPDVTPPSITAPAAVNVQPDQGSCYATNVNLGIPTTSDDCKVASVVHNAPAAFPPGTTKVTWTVTDEVGNKATATQLVSVAESSKPLLTVPADIVVHAEAGKCGATVAYALDTRCAATSIEYLEGLQSGSLFPIGTTRNMVRVRDAAGRASTGIFSVTVLDQQPPVVRTKPVVLDLNSRCAGTVTAAQTDNGSFDNCGILDMVLSKTEFSCADVGTHTVTLTVTDHNGNTGSATTEVTVRANVFLAHPNPFNAVTMIDYTIGPAGSYRLELMDMKGAIIYFLAAGENKENAFLSYELDGNRDRLAEGVYIARLTTTNSVKNLKIILKK